MFSLNRMSDGFGSHQQKSRQFSTTARKDNLLNEMPSSSSFFDTINLQNIPLEKKFANPNFVNKNNPNIHSYPSNFNLQTPLAPLQKICTEFYKNNSDKNPPQSIKSFSMEYIMKENTQRKKGYNLRKPKEHHRSPCKSHKNKMNVDIKYEIDEIGTDCLSDQFESDSNAVTPIIEIETPPIFIHEAMPEIEIKTEVCKISSSPICIAIGTQEQMCSAMVLSFTEDVRHRRMSSECSEDIVVFQYDEGDNSYTQSETKSDEEDSESICSDDEDDDVCDNDKFETDKCCKAVKKVTFAENLCKIHPMVSWSYAYQAARKGPWEQIARDRCRFNDRIAKMEDVLKPVLKEDHRKKMYKERYSKNIDK